MNRIISELSVAIQRFEYILPSLFGRFPYPPPNFAIAAVGSESNSANQVSKPFTVQDLIGDGFLWAVPKFRRSLERRMKRKYGSPLPGQHAKFPQTNKRLRECEHCSEFYDPKELCPTCYNKVRQETESIKELIFKKIGLGPIDKDVVVLYDGEKGATTPEFWEGKRIVELPKPRPQWFGKNLLQKSTKEIDKETKAVKPDELG